MLPGVWDESYARLAAQGEANKTAALQQGSGGQIAVVRSMYGEAVELTLAAGRTQRRLWGRGMEERELRRRLRRNGSGSSGGGWGNGREGGPKEATEEWKRRRGRANGRGDFP